MERKLNIVNPHLKFQKVSLVEPSQSYYLHIAAEIDHSSYPFFLATSAKKKQVIGLANAWCNELKNETGIESAVVFKARLIPPGRGKFIKETKQKVHIAKFDFAVLIEASSSGIIENIRQSHRYKEIEQAIKNVSASTHIISATNVKRINQVNHARQGVFLFNYFFAESLQQNLDIWEYTAGWFQQETGLDNSTVLLPCDKQQSSYTIINHCRWNRMSDVLPSLIFKKSFHSYVLDNFYANNVAAMPVLYNMVA